MPSEAADRVDFEGELAVIIGRLCRGGPREQAEDVVFGYTCANDVTARDCARPTDVARGKGYDTFCPLGPWMRPSRTPPTSTSRRGRRRGQAAAAGTAEMSRGAAG